MNKYPFEAVLFDLDDTLFDTFVYHDLREKKEFPKIIQNLTAHPIMPYEGITEVFCELKKLGVKIGIVTSSPREYAEKILSTSSLHYDTIVTGSDTTDTDTQKRIYPKPSPDSIEYACKKLNLLHSDKILFIGDRCLDIFAAFQASTRRKMTIKPGIATWLSKNLRDSISLPINKYIFISPYDILNPDLNKYSSSYFPLISKENIEGASQIKELDYYASRYYYARKGSSLSYAASNNLVLTFKSKNVNQKFFRDRAARCCAIDFLNMLKALELDIQNIKIHVIFVLPSSSSINGPISFEASRWECFKDELRTLLKNNKISDEKLFFNQEIQQLRSTDASHLSSSENAKNADLIKNNLQYTGKKIPFDVDYVIIFDDIITTGAHIKSYYDLVKSNLLNVNTKIIALSWMATTHSRWCDVSNNDKVDITINEKSN